MDNRTWLPSAVLNALCEAARAIGKAARLRGVPGREDRVWNAFSEALQDDVILGDRLKIVDAYREGIEG